MPKSEMTAIQAVDILFKALYRDPQSLFDAVVSQLADLYAMRNLRSHDVNRGIEALAQLIEIPSKESCEAKKRFLAASILTSLTRCDSVDAKIVIDEAVRSERAKENKS